MLKRSFTSKTREAKIGKSAKRSFNEAKMRKTLEKAARVDSPMLGAVSPPLTSTIVTIVVGPEQSLFAAHEDVLAQSPFFERVCREQLFNSNTCRIALPDEAREVFSCVVEYLYKGDYFPRLIHDRHRNSWMLEQASTDGMRPASTDQPYKPARPDGGIVDPTIFHPHSGNWILRDTAVYCSAHQYGLEGLKKLALRKQGLQTGIEVATILHSASFAYENTPDSDSRLRAHYLALIIRSRQTFKRSGTMQIEMEKGGKLFFDLFVAMCNHIDDLTGEAASAKGTPRSTPRVH